MNHVTDAQRGDEAAGRRLWELSYQRLIRYAYANCASMHLRFDEVDDVVQMALFKAFSKLSTFDRKGKGKDPFFSWMVGILKNTAKNYVRGERRHDIGKSSRRSSGESEIPSRRRDTPSSR